MVDDSLSSGNAQLAIANNQVISIGGVDFRLLQENVEAIEALWSNAYRDQFIIHQTARYKVLEDFFLTRDKLETLISLKELLSDEDFANRLIEVLRKYADILNRAAEFLAPSVEHKDFHAVVDEYIDTRPAQYLAEQEEKGASTPIKLPTILQMIQQLRNSKTASEIASGLSKTFANLADTCCEAGHNTPETNRLR